jgi:hypothetical protein
VWLEITGCRAEKIADQIIYGGDNVLPGVEGGLGCS